MSYYNNPFENGEFLESLSANHTVKNAGIGSSLVTGIKNLGNAFKSWFTPKTVASATAAHSAPIPTTNVLGKKNIVTPQNLTGMDAAPGFVTNSNNTIKTVSNGGEFSRGNKKKNINIKNVESAPLPTESTIKTRTLNGQTMRLPGESSNIPPKTPGTPPSAPAAPTGPTTQPNDQGMTSSFITNGDMSGGSTFITNGNNVTTVNGPTQPTNPQQPANPQQPTTWNGTTSVDYSDNNTPAFLRNMGPEEGEAFLAKQREDYRSLPRNNQQPQPTPATPVTDTPAQPKGKKKGGNGQESLKAKLKENPVQPAENTVVEQVREANPAQKEGNPLGFLDKTKEYAASAGASIDKFMVDHKFDPESGVGKALASISTFLKNPSANTIPGGLWSLLGIPGGMIGTAAGAWLMARKIMGGGNGMAAILNNLSSSQKGMLAAGGMAGLGLAGLGAYKALSRDDDRRRY